MKRDIVKDETIRDWAPRIRTYQWSDGEVHIDGCHEHGDTSLHIPADTMPALAEFVLDCLTAEQRTALLDRYCTLAEPAECTR